MFISTAPLVAMKVMLLINGVSAPHPCLIPSMALVESIPLYVELEGNATRGISVVGVWKHLLSLAAEEVNVVSFYWTLTGEDIHVNSSTSLPVSQETRSEKPLNVLMIVIFSLMMMYIYKVVGSVCP